MFEPVRAVGLYWTTFEDPGEAVRTLPFGRRSDPACMAERRPEVTAEPPVDAATQQKTPSCGDQATSFRLTPLVGKLTKPVQFTPSGLRAEH